MHKFYLYNTATRQKELFVPQHEVVGLYCCGPTVYNFAHIGNLRTYLFEDVLKRTLIALGYKVKHVLNITDVGHLTSDADSGDDKMEKGANREGKSVWEIADYYTQAFKKNLKDLNVIEPDIWPKATNHIPEMISLIKTLQEKGFTYNTGDGVYFDTTKFPEYATFARLDVENLQAGNRVEMGEKKSATDFALWKFSPKNVKRQMEWDSPWGIGFPGWHIECSAMSLKYLEQPLDIHCGGMDHVRVHHTNEIAQTEAATGKKFAKYWLHGEFLVVDKGKMAKSSGEFLTLDTIVKDGMSAAAYRMFCFTAHYRSPLMFSMDGFNAAASGLANLKKLVLSETKKPIVESKGLTENAIKHLDSFFNAVCDDLNMPVAVSQIWAILKASGISSEEKYKAMEIADLILGLSLLNDNPQIVVDVEASGIKAKIFSAKEIDKNDIDSIVLLLSRRKIAKTNKDFSTADSIRAQLKELHVEIKDLPGGIHECHIGI